MRQTSIASAVSATVTGGSEASAMAATRSAPSRSGSDDEASASSGASVS